MNRKLVDSWNNTVSDDDIVIYLGDLAFSEPGIWLSKLNGDIIFIQGNHDYPDRIGCKMHQSIGFQDCGENFLFIHSPWDVPPDWNGWVVHGHSHNNGGSQVDWFNKRINVSVEMTGYRPVKWSRILELCNIA